MDNEAKNSKDKWLKCRSKSGRFYMFNQATGESHWCKDSETKSTSSKSKTPAQDRLARIQAKLKETQANEKSGIEKPGKLTMSDASKKPKNMHSHANDEPQTKKRKQQMTVPSSKATATSTNEPELKTYNLNTSSQKSLLNGITNKKESQAKSKESQPSKQSTSTTTKISNKITTKGKFQETLAEPVSTKKESLPTAGKRKIANTNITKVESPLAAKSMENSAKSNTNTLKPIPVVSKRTIEKRKYKIPKKVLGTKLSSANNPIRDRQPSNEILPSIDNDRNSVPKTPKANANVLPYNKGSANKRLALLQNELRQKLKEQMQTRISNEIDAKINDSLLAANSSSNSDTSRTESNNSVYADCEPMEWEPMDVDAAEVDEKATTNAVSSPDTKATVNEPIMGDYYDNVNENLMRLVAKKNSVRDWKTDHFYFVIDTNVLLEYLTFVDDLLKMKLGATDGTIIYLPYTVLQELDKLKDRPPSESAKTRAMRAIKYLNQKFESKCDNVQVQSEKESRKEIVDVTSPDDRIINCCLQVKENVTNYIFLTEDINLRNKAITNDLLVSTKSQLIQFPV